MSKLLCNVKDNAHWERDLSKGATGRIGRFFFFFDTAAQNSQTARQKLCVLLKISSAMGKISLPVNSVGKSNYKPAQCQEEGKTDMPYQGEKCPGMTSLHKSNKPCRATPIS